MTESRNTRPGLVQLALALLAMTGVLCCAVDVPEPPELLGVAISSAASDDDDPLLNAPLRQAGPWAHAGCHWTLVSVSGPARPLPARLGPLTSAEPAAVRGATRPRPQAERPPPSHPLPR